MKIQENGKWFVLIYMAGFLAGILYANMIAKDYIASVGIFNDYFLETYAQMEIDTTEFLWYVASVRLLPVAFLVITGISRLRRPAVLAFVLWTGFSSGLILTAAVMKLGAKGIVLCLVSLFPHMCCYVAGYLMLLWFLYTYPKTRWNLTKTVAFLFLMAVGILLESYVNPTIMKIFIGNQNFFK